MTFKQPTLIRQEIPLPEQMSKGHPHLNPLPSRERKLDYFAVSRQFNEFLHFSLGVRRTRPAACAKAKRMSDGG